MKILGIIPARGGSKGIVGKNIKILNGKPLIGYTIEQAQKSKLLNKFIVSTDEQEIANVAINFHAEVPFLRPKEISDSKSTSLELIIHVINFFENKGEFFDSICLLQPTSPFRPENTIDLAIKTFIDSDKDSLISIREVPSHYNPYWTFFDDGGCLVKSIPGKIITRRQDLPLAFHRDGAIYISKVEYIKKNQSILSEDVVGFKIDSPQLINIDNLDDWEVAEKFIR